MLGGTDVDAGGVGLDDRDIPTWRRKSRLGDFALAVAHGVLQNPVERMEVGATGPRAFEDRQSLKRGHAFGRAASVVNANRGDQANLRAFPHQGSLGPRPASPSPILSSRPLFLTPVGRRSGRFG